MRVTLGVGVSLGAILLFLSPTCLLARERVDVRRDARRVNLDLEIERTLESGKSHRTRAYYPDQPDRSRHPSESFLNPGEGGGADVGQLLVVQTQFMDSACDEAECGAPCNAILISWRENTPNGRADDGLGVSVVVNDNLVMQVDGLPEDQLPGFNSVTVTGLSQGLAEVIVESRIEASFGTESVFVFDAQPFSDAENVRCESGAAANNGSGTCAILILWDNPGPRPGLWTVAIDDLALQNAQGAPLSIPGSTDRIEVIGLPPGDHTIAVRGLEITESGNYQGCEVSAACAVSCSLDDCAAPIGLRLCQSGYSPLFSGNEIRVEWVNAEDPYTVGVTVFANDSLVGTLANSELAWLMPFAPGLARIGVQGDCEDFTSSITEATHNVASTSPITEPVIGNVFQEFDSVTGRLAAEWLLGTMELDFIDVFVDTPQGLFFLGTASGLATDVAITNATVDDTVVLQLYGTADGACYGSELISALTRPENNNFVRGVCEGNRVNPQVSSGISVLNFVFRGTTSPPCLAACDANADGSVDIADGPYILNFVFRGGRAPIGWQDQDGDLEPDPSCEEASPVDCAEPSPVCPL